jgi:RNA polymerase sigma-70 factor, ECF subfamily
MKASEIEHIYKTYYNYGLTVALYYVRNIEDALSIYNDAILKIMDTDMSQVINIKAWLRKIVVNKAIDYNRKYFSKDYEDIIELGARLEFDPSIHNNLEVEELIQVIHTIPPSYRTVFLLHVVEGFKFIEIAEQLQITEGGAKTLYLKARKKLQVLLTTEYREYGHR